MGWMLVWGGLTLYVLGVQEVKLGGWLMRWIKAWADNDKPLRHGKPFGLFASLIVIVFAKQQTRYPASVTN